MSAIRTNVLDVSTRYAGVGDLVGSSFILDTLNTDRTNVTVVSA